MRWIPSVLGECAPGFDDDSIIVWSSQVWVEGVPRFWGFSGEAGGQLYPHLRKPVPSFLASLRNFPGFVG